MNKAVSNEPTFSSLTAFERDLLYAIRTLERSEPPKGLAVKEYLEADRDEPVHHSRLYQNLDGLVDAGLLTKGQKDARTNEYATTDEARRILEQRTERRAAALGVAGGIDG